MKSIINRFWSACLLAGFAVLGLGAASPCRSLAQNIGELQIAPGARWGDRCRQGYAADVGLGFTYRYSAIGIASDPDPIRARAAAVNKASVQLGQLSERARGHCVNQALPIAAGGPDRYWSFETLNRAEQSCRGAALTPASSLVGSAASVGREVAGAVNPAGAGAAGAAVVGLAAGALGQPPPPAVHRFSCVLAFEVYCNRCDQGRQRDEFDR